ncbi:hypothetical protein KEU06_02785 [Pseudaminobacter sp. 19-2017]|uniref:Anti-sigma factor NepR domain-containing protein n=1 Tax=Pseudaminobacter soli (ex Zhang et al. 2022) TaxID=2831468 RepID=A0A942I1B9_9HYPH|nr:hypothetical protein [Pseudaminobacter soli]MBS3647552.1 hypothetical protein [Pseudaminobacter soli]
MGRAVKNNINEAREIPEGSPLEDQLAPILDAVEAEPVPENLQKLATELQTVLEERRQRRKPK